MNIIKAITFASMAMLLSSPAPAQEINIKDRFQVTSDDGQFSLRLTGRLQVDGNLYDNDVTDHGSGLYVRRARIGIEGNFGAWEYELVYENATAEADLKNAGVTRKLGPGKLYLGHWKMFEGIEELTSSADISFIERSAHNASVAGRQLGARWNGLTANKKFGYGVSAYNAREAAEFGSRADNDGFGYSARAYFVPVDTGDRALHFGASAAFEKSDIAGERGRFRPAGRSNDDRFVFFDARGNRADQTRYNLEGIAKFGQFVASAEYMMGESEVAGRADGDYTLYYIQGGYTFAGEARRYDSGNGRLRNPRTRGAQGAWEVSARYQGGENKLTNQEFEILDFGLTYFANRVLLFKTTYSTVLKNEQADDEPAVLAVRMQWSF